MTSKYDNCSIVMTTGQYQDEIPWHCSGYTRVGIVLMSIPCIIIMLTIVFGNGLVLAAFACNIRLRLQFNNWYIVSLALADFFVGAFVMPFTLAQEIMGFWYFGFVLCELWLALDVLFVTASILNMCVISLDRYWAVHWPTSYRQKRDGTKVAMLISIAWILSFIISFPPLVGWKTVREEGICEVSTKLGYVLYSSFGSFFIPVIIICLVYIKIHTVARRISRRKLQQSKQIECSLLATASNAATSTPERRPLKARSLVPLKRVSQTSNNSRPSVATDRAKSVQIPNCDEAVNSQLLAALNSETPGNKLIPQVQTICSVDENSVTHQLTKMHTDIDHKTPDRPTSIRSERHRQFQNTYDQVVNSRSFCAFRFSGSGESGGGRLSNSMSSKNETNEARLSTERTTGQEATAAVSTKKKHLKRKERKSNFVVMLIIVSFVACWLPFFTLYVLGAVAQRHASISSVPELVFKIFFWLGYCNSALNPLIYTIFNTDFRTSFKRLLRVKHCICDDS